MLLDSINHIIPIDQPISLSLCKLCSKDSKSTNNGFKIQKHV